MQGKTKRGCTRFDTPSDRALSGSPTGVAQQIEISAAHEPQAAAHQSNGSTTQVVRFPGRPGWNASLAEQDFGNLAIRCTGQVRIQSTKCKHELLTLQLREGIGRSNGALAGQQPPEAQRRIGACCKIGVKRAHRRDRRVNLEAAYEQESKTPIAVADNPMFAVTRVTPEDRRQRAKRARTREGCGRWNEKNGGRIKLWQPNQRGVVGLQIRVERETAPPNEGRTRRCVCFPSGGRPRGSLACTKDCAAGIPTQAPSD